MRPTWKNILQSILSLILIVLGGYFFAKNGGEVRSVATAFRSANPFYLLIALAGLGITVLAQALALQASYRSLSYTVPLRECITLYFKRFFLSPFIPGGFSVAQYTLTKDLAHHRITPQEHTFASTVYVLSTMVSYIIFLVPVILLTSRIFFHDSYRSFMISYVTAAVLGIAGALIYLFRHVMLKRARTLLKSHVGHFHSDPIVEAVVISLLIDFSGVVTLWAGLHAVGLDVKILIAAAAYILTVLMITISPLFQGLVVVESALVYFLGQAGVPTAGAIAGALVFRGFQLWLPLVVGGFVYALPLWRKAHKKITGT